EVRPGEVGEWKLVESGKEAAILKPLERRPGLGRSPPAPARASQPIPGETKAKHGKPPSRGRTERAGNKGTRGAEGGKKDEGSTPRRAGLRKRAEGSAGRFPRGAFATPFAPFLGEI